MTHLTAIWPYDQFPYALASEIDEIKDGVVTVKGYGRAKWKKARITIAVDAPDTEAALNRLARDYRAAQQVLRSEYMEAAKLLVPELAMLRAYGGTI